MPPRHIAIVAQPLVGEPVEESDVITWIGAAGLTWAPRPEAPARTIVPTRRGLNRRGDGMITRPCTRCGTSITRYPCEMPDEPFCSAACCREYRREQGAKRREQRHALAEEAKRGRLPMVPEVPDTKRCATCHRVKPIREFRIDRSRRDLHARECGVCSNARSNAYYRDNADRLRLRARERKQAAKSSERAIE